MMLSLLVSTAAALMTLFVVNNDIKPLAASAFTLLNETLPRNLTTFETNFLLPMDELLAKAIQERSLSDLKAHTFLDKQSYADDVIGKPVFDLLTPLTNYSLLYPTVNNRSIECEYMNITQPSASAFAHGIFTGRRKLGRATCFFSELALLIALIVTGVLYTMSVMTQDAIIVLQCLDQDTNVFLPSAQSAEGVNRLLFDQNFVEATSMTATLEFSDTLRIPPHPTPATDNPERFNFSELYDMPALFALEELTADSDKALVEMFAWNEEFVSDKLQQLRVLALTDSTVATPYNKTLHQDLLNSTIQQLMDPDNDGDLVTARDLSEIQTVFNASWRGLDDQDNLIEKTKAMEDAEFRLKAPVEFVTDSIRASKIADCNYNGNCALNELFDLFQKMALKAERATISCAVSAVAMVIAILCTNAFTSRMRRNAVKVYISG
uniref:Uncharacterized protein n=1 Tax=Phytophthora ramorum TaxID=164328 RepID=H3HD11_PHYRM